MEKWTFFKLDEILFFFNYQSHLMISIPPSFQKCWICQSKFFEYTGRLMQAIYYIIKQFRWYHKKSIMLHNLQLYLYEQNTLLHTAHYKLRSIQLHAQPFIYKRYICVNFTMIYLPWCPHPQESHKLQSLEWFWRSERKSTTNNSL